MNGSIIISELQFTADCLRLYYSGDSIQFAWLENIDKHFPDVFEVSISFADNCIVIPIEIILKIQKKNITVKLSISSDSVRLNYVFLNTVLLGKTVGNLTIKLNDNSELVFESIESKNIEQIKLDPRIESEKLNAFLKTRKTPMFVKHDIIKCPLKIIVIGTCFARSVFKSDDYFNPDYKKYFTVAHTFFHNSLLSLMSEPIDDKSYLKINDLLQDEVFRYIDIEFKKNFFETIDSINPDFIIMDNYIDATRPIIQITENQFMTYNSYFSKSIYKRTFSNCKIIYPFEDNYTELYRKYARMLAAELKLRNLDRQFILLGGRLSESKIDNKTGKIESWNDLDYWIRPSNANWERIDQILLEEISNAEYIDMRETVWKSDIDCHSIKGGASPSHYQSEYYREIFERIKVISLRY